MRDFFTVLHRIGKPTDDGWYHMMPYGEFNAVIHAADGQTKRIKERVTVGDLREVMRSHAQLLADPDWPGYLVGLEHESQREGGTTKAAAWARDLELRDNGIWAKLNKTPLGAELIGSVYKYFSTVNPMRENSDGTYSPVAIDDIGLTNKPAYSGLSPARHTKERDSTMLDKTLTGALGVPESATAEDAVKAIKALHTKQAETEAKLTKATTDLAEHRKAALEVEATAFVAAHTASIEKPAELKAAYIADPEGTKKLFGFIRHTTAPAAETAKALHRKDTAQPDGLKDDIKAAHTAAQVRTLATEIAAKEGIPFNQAFHRAAKQVGQ